MSKMQKGGVLAPQCDLLIDNQDYFAHP